MGPDNEETSNTLIVRHLPAELSPADREDLLKHFGAESVKCMSDKGRMKHTAFATFTGHQTAEKALTRLHQLEVLGRRLVVEFAKKQHKKHMTVVQSDQDNEETIIKEEKDKKSADSTDDKKPAESNQRGTLPQTAIASSLGLQYVMNPRLHYLYPPPTASILNNIANTLAAVPKLYVQVLHLMNKMNLPAPFGPLTQHPPLATEMEYVGDDNLAEEEMSESESELESDEETQTGIPGQAQGKGVKRPAAKKRRPHKRPRLQALPPLVQPRPSTQPAPAPGEVFEQPEGVGVKKIELNLPSAIEAERQVEEDDEERVAGEADQDTSEMSGFGKFEPPPVVMETEEEEEPEDESTDFISSRELRRGRLSHDDIRKLSVFKNYSAGEPNCRLYIKNVAKQTEEKDLRFIYGRYVNFDDDIEKEMFDIRLMKEGRMKGQAFIGLPSEKVAQKAVRDTNGFELNGKPLVVQFARSAKPKEKADSKDHGKGKIGKKS
ncbi:RNA-binding region-containing protein 3-like [Branchiostoma floridae]|uniref:RNA-binding region-containing protein 3 n=1 Tax=Branchiostoma floridae TaxID=7739 RepID=A0A9J7L0D4_BRAFL|nr:RNA-binding region-containing protein 3-like [Branchiostoma floridae]